MRGKRARKARALLASVLKATWRGRVDGTVDAKTGARHADILALATLPRRRGQRRADRACLRIAIAGATGRKATGTFTLLGATGVARKLSLSGTFAYGGGNVGSIAGTARVRTRAPRALSASCPRAGGLTRPAAKARGPGSRLTRSMQIGLLRDRCRPRAAIACWMPPSTCSSARATTAPG